MKPVSDQPIQPPTLPQLEHLLVRTARRRKASGFGRRRWVIAIAAASLLLAAGAVAATNVFEIAGGETSGGAFAIESRRVPPVQTRAGESSICLQLRFGDRGSAYGCGERPTVKKPFGLVIADPLDSGAEQVVYGLVTSDIAQVSILGAGGSKTDATTHQKVELPGRFFSAVTPRGGRIELVGYSAAGDEVARLGSLEPRSQPPLSKAEAMAQGDPAGFAPGVSAPSTYIYKGEVIEPRIVTQLGLACLQERSVMRCFDSAEEVERATGH